MAVARVDVWLESCYYFHIMQDKKQNIFSRIWAYLRRESQWFRPGLGYKRWLILVLMGTTLLGMGLTMFVLHFYRTAPETWWLPALSYLSLRFLDRPIRVIIFGGLGVIMIILGIWRSNRSLLKPFVPPGKSVIDALDTFRRRDRGPELLF